MGLNNEQANSDGAATELPKTALHHVVEASHSWDLGVCGGFFSPQMEAV